MTAETWAGRAIIAAFAIGCAVWGFIAFRESWGRAAKVIDDARAEIAAGRHDTDALAITCDPCNSRPGRHCQCFVKCGHPKCGAADTRIRAWSPAELACLRGETDTLPATTDIPEENPS